MNKPLEITADEIYRGSARTVVALSLGGSPPALEYLRNLEKSNKKGHDIIHGYFDSPSNEKEIHERATFKCLDRGRRLYEFRPSSLRLYCFLYEDTLIFLTNGGTKNNKKEQNVSRSELAARMGVQPSRITAMLEGTGNLTIDTLVRAGMALGAELHQTFVTAHKQVRWIEYEKADTSKW